MLLFLRKEVLPFFLFRNTGVYLILTSVVLAPFLAMRFPAMGDTLNHLARMHVLVDLQHSADLQRYYTVHWSPIPYLAMDAIVPLLARVLPIYLAGKLFVCACVLMPAAGTACLHYVVHRRASLVPAAAFLLCTNYLLALGFLNYLFSAGLAVLLFAGWIAAAGWPRWRRALVFAPLVLLLYFGHAFACLAYCLSVAGLEGANLLRGGPGRVWDVVAAAAQAVPALAFAATLHMSAGYVGALQTAYGTFADKLVALASPMLFLRDPAGLFSVLAVLLLGLAVLRFVRVAPAIWPAAASVSAAAAMMPHVLSSTWGMDLRLPLVSLMLLTGGTSWAGPRLARRRLAAIVLALVCLRSADSWSALRTVDGQIREHRRILAALPRGARLLVVNTEGHGTGTERIAQSTVWHMPLVAVIDRDAFVPYIFNGLTTIRVNQDFRSSSTPNGLPLSPADLRAGETLAEDHVERGDGQGARLYFRGWPEKFDYVLVQHYGASPGVLPAVLQPFRRGDGIDLYKIAHH